MLRNSQRKALLKQKNVGTVIIIILEALDMPTIQIIHNSPTFYTIYFHIQLNMSDYHYYP